MSDEEGSAPPCRPFPPFRRPSRLQRLFAGATGQKGFRQGGLECKARLSFLEWRKASGGKEATRRARCRRLTDLLALRVASQWLPWRLRPHGGFLMSFAFLDSARIFFSSFEFRFEFRFFVSALLFFSCFLLKMVFILFMISFFLLTFFLPFSLFLFVPDCT